MLLVPNIIGNILYPAIYACLAPLLFLGALALVALLTRRLPNLRRAGAGVLLGAAISVALALIDHNTINLASKALDIHDLAIVLLAGIFGGYAGFLSLALIKQLARKKQETFAIAFIAAILVIFFYFLFFAGNMQGFMTVFVFFYAIGLIVQFMNDGRNVLMRAE